MTCGIFILSRNVLKAVKSATTMSIASKRRIYTDIKPPVLASAKQIQELHRWAAIFGHESNPRDSKIVGIFLPDVLRTLSSENWYESMKMPALGMGLPLHLHWERLHWQFYQKSGSRQLVFSLCFGDC